MAARNWDKVRREKRSSGGYHSLTGTDYEAKALHARKQRKLHRRKPKRASQTIATPPSKPATKPAARWLVIDMPSGQAVAVFVRTSKDNHWRCTGTDHPSLSWFTGIRHIQLIADWLLKNHYPFRWLFTNPTLTTSANVPAGTASQNPPEQLPAEAYTPAKASQGSPTNTERSLITNPTGVSLPGALPASGLAQTGVTTSLLLPRTSPIAA